MSRTKLTAGRSRCTGIALALTIGAGLVGLHAGADAAAHYLAALGISTVEQGREAPGFALADSTGKVHRLRDYRGRVVLLSFGATW